jgi:cyanophycinase
MACSSSDSSAVLCATQPGQDAGTDAYDSSNSGDVDSAAEGSEDALSETQADTASEAGVVHGNRLIIIGGALNDSSPIWARTIDEAGGRENVRFLVVNAAITASAGSFAYYQDLLSRIYGVSLDNVQRAKITDIDDPETKFEDESTWKDNADDEAEVAKVRDWATIVWFSGGDQAHIMSTFLHSDGTDRKVTTAIRDKLAAGKLVVAGSSAGGAVMSDPMIGEGDPYSSWLFSPIYAPFYPEQEPDGGFNPDYTVVLNKGLGFLNARTHVLIDTHWFERARFLRTIRALDFISSYGNLDPKMKVGLGLGENSALLVDLGTGIAEVLGDSDASRVGVVDINEAKTSGVVNPYELEQVRVGFLGVRDRFVLPTDANPTGTYLSEATKNLFKPCNGYLDVPPLEGDMLIPGAYVEILQNLLDGTPDTSAGAPFCHADGFINRLSPGQSSIDGGTFTVEGFFFRFTTDSRTKEYYNSSWGWEVENAIMRVGWGSGTYTPPF